MKNQLKFIVTIFTFLFLFSSCELMFDNKAKKNPNVLTKEIRTVSYVTSKKILISSLVELIDSASNKYTNYEINAEVFSINWNAKDKYLFVKEESCSWPYGYQNVDLDKLKAIEIPAGYFKVNSRGISELIQFLNKSSFEAVPSKEFNLYRDKYLKTNICLSNGGFTL